MSKRLLVVDDEPNLLVAVAACLRGEGYEVTTARSGREGLVRLEGFRQVGVHTVAEALDAIRRLVFRGQEDDGHKGGAGG